MEHLDGEDLFPSISRITENHFIKLLGLSLILHLACFLLLLTPGTRNSSPYAVAMFDLTMTAPAQTAAPPPTETKQEMAAPEPVPAPEPVLRQETPPETAFDKLKQDVRQAVDMAESRPEAMAERSLSLGITDGYFSSFADGQSLHPAVRDYYFTILKTINETWWVTTGGKKGARSKAIVNIFIDREGHVIKVVLVKSSGNQSYDRSIIRAVEASNPLPPLPAEFPSRVFDAPLLFNPPLMLMSG